MYRWRHWTEHQSDDCQRRHPWYWKRYSGDGLRVYSGDCAEFVEIIRYRYVSFADHLLHGYEAHHLSIGLFDLMAIISFCGPLIAWSFIGTTSVGWRGAYYFMTGFHAAALVLLFFAYHPPTFQTKHRIDGKTKLQLVKEMDFVGLFLFAGGCILFLLGINYGGKQYPWKDAHVIAPIVTGVLSLVALGFWEAYADLAYPLMPPRLFKRWRQ
jgi:MFS family permease